MDIFRHLKLDSGSIVADPWNGSGTTTSVAHRLGFRAHGFDINPVMVLVAKARLLGPVVRPSHLSLAENMIEHALRESGILPEEEPLETWFAPSAARTLRQLERAVQRLLITKTEAVVLADPASLDLVSPLAAFFYTALFRTARDFVHAFKATNPTWIKTPAKTSRVRPNADTICLSFLAHVSEMAPLEADEGDEAPDRSDRQSKVQLGTSDKLLLKSSSVDAVITSPPYCTRIDYAVAIRPELAVLGLSMRDQFAELRRGMSGTPAIVRSGGEPLAVWGPTCGTFLQALRSHRSRASSTYYFKTHLQYFGSVYDSLRELHRVLRPSGSCTIVVQDSYYKEIHNDLPRIFIEMAESLGWGLRHRWDFPIERTMATLNRRHHKYRCGASAVESALWFCRG